jgi:hypothetical protein
MLLWHLLLSIVCAVVYEAGCTRNQALQQFLSVQLPVAACREDERNCVMLQVLPWPH